MRALLTLLAAVAALASAAPARELLRDILHPKADLPAFRCTVPVDWRDATDAHGNLQLANAARTATFSLAIVHCANPREALDALAKAVLSDAIVAPWEAREPAEISGYRGNKYSARVRYENGVELRAEVILVSIGDEHVGSCSMLLAERITRDDETLARLTFGNIKLLPSH